MNNTLGLSFLYFTAAWCGPCKAFGPLVNEVFVDQPYELTKVDIDADPELAVKFQIRGVPTLVAVIDGDEIDRSVGLLSKERLENFISEAALKASV